MDREETRDKRPMKIATIEYGHTSKGRVREPVDKTTYNDPNGNWQSPIGRNSFRSSFFDGCHRDRYNYDNDQRTGNWRDFERRGWPSHYRQYDTRQSTSHINGSSPILTNDETEVGCREPFYSGKYDTELDTNPTVSAFETFRPIHSGDHEPKQEHFRHDIFDGKKFDNGKIQSIGTTSARRNFILPDPFPSANGASENGHCLSTVVDLPIHTLYGYPTNHIDNDAPAGARNNNTDEQPITKIQLQSSSTREQVKTYNWTSNKKPKKVRFESIPEEFPNIETTSMTANKNSEHYHPRSEDHDVTPENPDKTADDHNERSEFDHRRSLNRNRSSTNPTRQCIIRPSMPFANNPTLLSTTPPPSPRRPPLMPVIRSDAWHRTFANDARNTSLRSSRLDSLITEIFAENNRKCESNTFGFNNPCLPNQVFNKSSEPKGTISGGTDSFFAKPGSATTNKRRSMMPCHWFKTEGSCKFGNHCRFSHDLGNSVTISNIPDASVNRPDPSYDIPSNILLNTYHRAKKCTDYNRGCCKMDMLCPFAHDPVHSKFQLH